MQFRTQAAPALRRFSDVPPPSLHELRTSLLGFSATPSAKLALRWIDEAERPSESSRIDVRPPRSPGWTSWNAAGSLHWLSLRGANESRAWLLHRARPETADQRQDEVLVCLGQDEATLVDADLSFDAEKGTDQVANTIAQTVQSYADRVRLVNAVARLFELWENYVFAAIRDSFESEAFIVTSTVHLPILRERAPSNMPTYSNPMYLPPGQLTTRRERFAPGLVRSKLSFTQSRHAPPSRGPSYRDLGLTADHLARIALYLQIKILDSATGEPLAYRDLPGIFHGHSDAPFHAQECIHLVGFDEAGKEAGEALVSIASMEASDTATGAVHVTAFDGQDESFDFDFFYAEALGDEGQEWQSFMLRLGEDEDQLTCKIKLDEFVDFDGVQVPTMLHYEGVDKSQGSSWTHWIAKEEDIREGAADDEVASAPRLRGWASVPYEGGQHVQRGKVGLPTPARS